jgi:hypothetical protein
MIGYDWVRVRLPKPALDGKEGEKESSERFHQQREKMAADQAQHGGVYCSTAGAVFSERDALADHYSSDYHR